MMYRDRDYTYHDMERDIETLNFEHEHPLVKQRNPEGKITVWCPICDIVFGVKP